MREGRLRWLGCVHRKQMTTFARTVDTLTVEERGPDILELTWVEWIEGFVRLAPF